MSMYGRLISTVTATMVHGLYAKNAHGLFESITGSASFENIGFVDCCVALPNSSSAMTAGFLANSISGETVIRNSLFQGAFDVPTSLVSAQTVINGLTHGLSQPLSKTAWWQSARRYQTHRYLFRVRFSTVVRTPVMYSACWCSTIAMRRMAWQTEPDTHRLLLPARLSAHYQIGL